MLDTPQRFSGRNPAQYGYGIEENEVDRTQLPEITGGYLGALDARPIGNCRRPPKTGVNFTDLEPPTSHKRRLAASIWSTFVFDIPSQLCCREP